MAVVYVLFGEWGKRGTNSPGFIQSFKWCEHFFVDPVYQTIEAWSALNIFDIAFVWLHAIARSGLDFNGSGKALTDCGVPRDSV